MAQRVEIILEDDTDGSVADETVPFALDGSSYEIDLNSSNAHQIRERLAPWIAAARTVRTSGRRMPRTPRAASTKQAGAPSDGPSRLATIREWARANGHNVSDRGRIAAAVQKAFDAAQTTPQG